MQGNAWESYKSFDVKLLFAQSVGNFVLNLLSAQSFYLWGYM